MILFIRAPQFAGPVALRDGRVVVPGTCAYLQRLRGLTEAAVRAYAAERGWTVSGDDASLASASASAGNK